MNLLKGFKGVKLLLHAVLEAPQQLLNLASRLLQVGAIQMRDLIFDTLQLALQPLFQVHPLEPPLSFIDQAPQETGNVIPHIFQVEVQAGLAPARKLHRAPLRGPVRVVLVQLLDILQQGIKVLGVGGDDLFHPLFQSLRQLTGPFRKGILTLLQLLLNLVADLGPAIGKLLGYRLIGQGLLG